MSTWRVRRVQPGWGWQDAPRVIVENAVDNTVRLNRRGIRQENRVYAPVYREGEQYQTQRGDRIRIEAKVVLQDGTVDTIIREAVDTGKAVPQYVEPVRSESYGITDAERAAGDAYREQYNQQIYEQNLINNYTQPWTPPMETVPDYQYSPYEGGYAENEPIATPANVYVPPAYVAPDTPQVYYNPNATAGAAIGGVIQIGEWVQDILPPETSDPWQDYQDYLTAQEQAENEGAWGWGGPIS